MSKHLAGLLASLLCCAPLGIGWAAAGERPNPFEASRNDPRSSALLNVIAARGAKAAATPTPAAPPAPLYIGFHSTVNNVADNSFPQDTQSTTTVVDLGGGNLVAAFIDSGSLPATTDHFTGYAWSNNNGVSWTDPGTLPDAPGGDGGDPVLAHHKAGNAVYLATPAHSVIHVFKSTDSGHTFGAPVNATPGFIGLDLAEKPWIAVDNFAGAGAGNVYVCGTHVTGATNIFLTRSTNGGASFTPSGGTLISTGGNGCFVAVSPNHQVSVFYYRGTGVGGQGGDNKIFMRRSIDQGVSFGAQVLVADLKTTTINGDLGLTGGGRSNSWPQAAVNPVAARPHIYVVYNDITPTVPSIKSDAYYVRSLDGGLTWSAPIRVNDDTAGDQYFPSVAFAGAGEQIMFGYYSRGHDPSNLLFHRRGRLGVLNVAGNLVLNKPSFQLGPNTPIVLGQDTAVDPAYIGGYDTIAGGAGQFSSVWSDNRLGGSVAGFSGIHARQPDVRFARIAAPPPAAELAVSVAAAPTSFALGQTVVFTVTATSTGGVANDVFINVPPAFGLAVQSINTASGQCSSINGFIGCSMGTIAAGASKRVQIVATPVVAAGTRIFSARATTSSADANALNNAASASVTVTAVTTVWSTHSSGAIAVPIEGAGRLGSRVDVPIAVPVEGNIVNFIARVRLNHSFDSDLLLSLIAPTGQIVALANRRGGSGDNYGGGANNCTGAPTNFYDFAATSIASGAPPFAGLFKPEEPLLNALAGAPTDGVWKLRVSNFNAVIGEIGCFSLSILRVP